MIQVNDKDKEYFLRNKPSEIKLFEFIKLAQMKNDKVPFMKQWLEILKMLCADDGIRKIPDDTLFNEIIPKWYEYKLSELDLVSEFELKGDKYTTTLNDNNEPIISVQTQADIETKINENKAEGWVHYALAYLIDNNTNTKQTIDERAELFNKELTSDIAVPYITHITNKVGLNFKKAIDIFKEENG